MGNKIHRRPDIEGTSFLGKDTDKHFISYLRHFYENDIKGDLSEKYDTFMKLYGDDDAAEFKKLIDLIGLPNDYLHVLANDGYID